MITAKEIERIRTEEIYVKGVHLGTTSYFYNADGSLRCSITVWKDGTVMKSKKGGE